MPPNGAVRGITRVTEAGPGFRAGQECLGPLVPWHLIELYGHLGRVRVRVRLRCDVVTGGPRGKFRVRRDFF